MKNNKFDQIEELPYGAIIQHGHYNDRIYVMKVAEDFSTKLPVKLISMAKKNNYSKIFVKIASKKIECFTKAGYAIEASVPKLCNQDTGVFLAFYLNEKRLQEDKSELYAKNIILALDNKKKQMPTLDTKRFLIRLCNKGDINCMVKIYKKVFVSYPFPIHESEYIWKTMNENIDYFCIQAGGEIIALASAEKDPIASNVEMTDFATLPKWRGNNLSVHLLSRMENEVKSQGIKTAYTIARAASAGMNITFSKMGYTFGGRLINNTNISGTVESMNVWYKQLVNRKTSTAPRQLADSVNQNYQLLTKF